MNNKIELHLFGGRSWDQLTDREMGIVARALVAASHAPSYTVAGVCLRILLEVNDLEVLYSNAEPSPDSGELEQVYYLRPRRDPKAVPIRLPLYHLHYWSKSRKDGGAGLFDWLLTGSRRTKPPRVPRCTSFLLRHLPSSWFSHPPLGGLRGALASFSPPKRYMPDWTWQQYRAVADYYEQYIRVANAVARGKLDAQYAIQARSQWLATIYCRRCWYRDASGLLRYGFHYREGQATAHQHRFDRIDEVEFQLILLWWEGMQHHLQTRYPKCFRRGGGGAKPDTTDPLSIYSRSIATLEKYSGSDEGAILQKTYTVVLQQLNDMVLEGEEYERMKHK